MQFALNDEQRQIQALADQFSSNEIQPRAAAADRDATFPMVVHEQAVALGLVTNLARGVVAVHLVTEPYLDPAVP